MTHKIHPIQVTYGLPVAILFRTLTYNQGSDQFISFNSIQFQFKLDSGFFNSIQFQFKLDSESFNSIPIQFIFFQFQFNSNFMHRSKQINQIAGYFKFNLNISSFAAQFRKHIIPDHDNSRITKSALVWFRYWANGLVPIRQQAITWKCFIHAALAGAELMC